LGTDDIKSAYHPPALYNGATAKVLKTSTVNATHWKADVVCCGCSSWFGGAASVPALGDTFFGYSVSNLSIANPASPSTNIGFHNVVHSHWEFNITGARNSAPELHEAHNADLKVGREPWVVGLSVVLGGPLALEIQIGTPKNERRQIIRT
jgi:hypothetical protein